jgi:hypothetical protein
MSKAPDHKAVMGLQEVQAGTAASACKTCRKLAIVWLHYSASTIDYSPVTATVQGDLIGWCHAAT